MKNLNRDSGYQEILSRLAQLSAESLRKWGTLTSGQMLCHMSDTLLNAMGERPTKQIDFLFSRTVMKWGSLWFPIPWPRGLKTLPEMDPLTGGTQPLVFQEDLATLHKLMDRFTATPRDFTFAVHPLLGPLSETEWMRLMYLHFDHHLRQFGV